MMENLRVIWQKAAIALLVSVVVNLLYNLILATIRSLRATNKITRKPFVPQRFLTLRISNIPRGENTKASLREILSDLPIEAQGIGGRPNLLGYSYAPTAVTSFATKYAVATATFEHAPALRELEMVLKQKLGDRDNHLKVDQDFLGMTPLYNSDDIDVECVILYQRPESFETSIDMTHALTASIFFEQHYCGNRTRRPCVWVVEVEEQAAYVVT